jgi:MFS superfamily sulfate permease-like transporter
MSQRLDTPPRSVKGPEAILADAVAGFLVFLVALPLCLAIARASNFPPIAGIWTAVAGGLIATWISNSQLTIKGPAAGLIVIVAGSVTELGAAFGSDLTEGDRLALGYRLTLGIGVVASIIQVLFGRLRLGKLADFFPLPAVHGMLAAIGIIIASKQAYILLGIDAPADLGPLELIAALPRHMSRFNPAITVIGLISLAIMFGLPKIKNRFVRRIPAPMAVLLIAVPLGLALNLEHRHTYLFPDSFFDAFGTEGEDQQHFSRYEVGPRFLVDMPEVLQNPAAAFMFPDFRGLTTWVGIKYVLLFALIGSLESLLSMKAIDLLDPWRRTSDPDRDLTAVGVANVLVAMIGGLPMISEIVRSSANIAYGARTRRANFFHGLFLLVFVIFFPNLIHRIPLAALAAMLVYTGWRLAHPHEFKKMWTIGKEPMAVFLITIAVTLTVDLLVGIAAGVIAKMILHWWHGTPPSVIFRNEIEVQPIETTTYRVTVRKAAIFANWLIIKRELLQLGLQANILLDLSEACFVDHTVMEKLHGLAADFKASGGRLEIIGLESHSKLSDHSFAARKKKSEPVADPS